MNYINTIIDFITLYDYFILPTISVVLAIFCIVNFCKNAYARQNKKIISVTRKICSYPDKTMQYANTLPTEYRRQWRAYLNSNAKQPSLVFEFAPIKYRVHLLRLFVLTAIVCCGYLVAFIFDTTRTDYLIFQIVFWLAFTLAMIADRQIAKFHERKAKQIFGRFVNELNHSSSTEQTPDEQFDDTINRIRNLAKCEHTNAVFDRASQLLREKGLNNGERTANQQRKLNNALNGLLQSYTKTNA